MHPLYAKPTALSPLLEVCYAVAKEAHKDAVRTKIGDSIPYITHPAIVYKILRAVGVDDPITLCAAFLHDVIEDCPRLNSPEKLAAELITKLQSANYPDAEKHAFLITDLCEELTNAKTMEEGKRGWQFEHGQRLSPMAKQVKIADQLASLIDDIILPSDRPNEKIRKFNMKALECAKACTGENPLLDNLFKVIFTDAMIVTDAGKPNALTAAKIAAGHVSNRFSLATAVDKAKHYPPGTPEEVPVKWKKHSDTAGAKTGIIKLGIAQSGKVCRFAALVDPHLDDDSPCNSALIKFIDELESVSPYRTTRKSPEIIDDRVVRSFTLKPAMELSEFIATALKNNAIESGYAVLASKPSPGEEYQRK